MDSRNLTASIGKIGQPHFNPTHPDPLGHTNWILIVMIWIAVIGVVYFFNHNPFHHD